MTPYNPHALLQGRIGTIERFGRILMRILLGILFATFFSGTVNASLEDTRHLLGRITFGPEVESLQQFAKLPYEVTVEQLLESATSAELPSLPRWVHDWRPEPRDGLTRRERKARRKVMRTRAKEMQIWWARHMVTTEVPTREILTLFWHNHFTSALSSVKAPALLFRQNQTLRRHALGNFGALLRAMTRDPAMLVYLDGFRNRASAPNENFARELLELFTLGQGAYGEEDVREIARAFTGWSLDRETGEFLFRKDWHDDGIKSILNRKGRFDGDDVVELILAHPQTAHFITEKFWRAFISESPDAGEVERLADMFRANDYEIRPLLKAILTSDAFLARENRGRLVKSPIELLVGTVRLFNADVRKPGNLVRASRHLGQDIFNPPNVKGWPGGTAWLTTDHLLNRQSLLSWLTGDQANAMMADSGSNEGQKRRSAAFDRWADHLPTAFQASAAASSLLLPLSPVDTELLDPKVSSALIRQLIQDPVYQLK